VAVEADGQRLSEAELINTCVTLFTAGHETTLSFIANTALLLLGHPDQLAVLRREPGLLGSALEESLRYESPVSRQSRLMKADVELGGRTIRQGDMVFQMLNAANRDPAHFADPDRFDVRRHPNRHIAFGQGIHFCVGAPLARAEATVATPVCFAFAMASRIAVVQPTCPSAASPSTTAHAGPSRTTRGTACGRYPPAISLRM
jgi:cytochrome P450